MRIALESPELVGLLQEQRLGKSELGEIATDSRLRESQGEALDQMDELSKSGLGDEDRAALNQLRRGVSADAQARQSSILDSMAQRGAMDSGSSLAAQLAGSQQATQRAAEGADRLAAQAGANRRNAIAQKAQMGSQLRSQDHGEKSQAAQARDEIAKFNAMNRQNVMQQNLANRQNIANMGTSTRNQEQMHNKSLGQQQFQNEMSKQGAMANAYTGAANMNMQQAGMMGKEKSGLSKALGGAGSGAAAGFAMGGPMGAGIGAGVGGLAGLMAEDGGIKGQEYRYGGIGAQLQTGNPEIDNDPIKMEQLDAAGKGQLSANAGPSINPQDAMKAVGALSSILDSGEQAPRQSFSSITSPYTGQGQDTGAVERLRQLPQMSYNDGGMGYNDGGESVIIDSGEESFAGDQLPDRINDGEMVDNVSAQNRLNDMLLELKQYRLDDSLASGDVSINDDQQEALLAVKRGDMELEDMPEDDILNAESPMGELMKLLAKSKRG